MSERPELPSPMANTPLSEEYTTDLLSRGKTLLGVAAAGFGGAALTLLAWKILKHTNLPAFGGSQLSRAVSTGSTVFVLLAVMALVFMWLGERKKWLTPISYVVFYMAPAALVITTTAIPLSATRLYLDGVTVDQGFRTQFLSRMAESSALSDMNYIDLPSFYPAGWFWVGGRFANLIGLPGWEAFQPWALVSMAAAACMLVPVWQRLCGSLAVATGIALVTTCITLAMAAEEPYAAIIALGVPAATVMGRRALDGAPLAMIGITLYLGASASMYTLFTAVVALSVIAVAAIFAVFVDHSFAPIYRLFAIGIGSGLIAATVWGPYLMAILRGAPHSGGTATHYLPPAGTQIPMPFFSLSIVGVLCMLGLIFLLVRSHDRDIRSMGISLVMFYTWIVASMIATLAGTTLLGFRLDIIVALQLATAGVLAVAEIRLVGLETFYPHLFSERLQRVTTFIMVTVLSLAGVSYAQTIPNRNATAIDLAYTDTDAYGDRADRYPGDAATYYSKINDYLLEQGFNPDTTVVLTDEQNFMSFFPYRGFQAFTSHYANPLGQFDERNRAIEKMADASWESRQEFDKVLRELPWQAPEVMIFRNNKYDIAEDLYPNNPNVRFRGVFFNPDAFDRAEWNEKIIGPFEILTRKK